MPESQSANTFILASSHPFRKSTEPSLPALPNSTMASASSSQQPEIPLTNLPPPPTYAGPNARNNNIDLEAAPASSEHTLNRHSSELPPNYKEQDMPEPLPPYMTRVKGVMRGQQPMAAAMPAVERRTARLVIAFFILVVLIFIGVGIGARVAIDSNHNDAPPR